jgi:hypothetical protein
MHFMTANNGALGLILLRFVSPCGVVLDSAYPYPRACLFLRRWVPPWW